MKIHEYQAKELLSKFEIPTLRRAVAFTPEEAGKVAFEQFQSNDINTIVIKAQVHAGGRGKGIIYDVNTNEPIIYNDKQLRGVNIISNDNISHSAYEIAKLMLNNKLVTIQTGQAGTIVRRLLIEEGCKIAKEFYLGITLDRQAGKNVVMASTEGGVEIEKVAAETPEKILKEYIDPTVGFQAFQGRRLAFNLGLSGTAFKNFLTFVPKLIRAYEELDANLVEINPLVLTADDEIIALDAKITFDDNALYRHPDFLHFEI
jgi:succinyl-CoA synthetase beta subunit